MIGREKVSPRPASIKFKLTVIYEECLTSLRFDNSRYGKISEEYRGSFEWIWTHDQYKKWIEADASRLLYLQGKPGSGKSTLTKYFTENLLKRGLNAKSATVAKFFYSDREGEIQRSHRNMLRSILYEILDQHEAFFYHCFQLEYRSQPAFNGRGGIGLVEWEYESLKRIFSSLLDYPRAEPLYLIIDAVDESDDNDRREILELLLRMCSGTNSCVVKAFVASRPVAALERRISEFHSFIRLQDETKPDISRLASSYLERMEFPDFLEKARRYVVDNANGVFLWVRLVGEELLAYDDLGYAEEDVFELLKSLPTELDDHYVRMLHKMMGNREKDLRDGVKMFRFVFFACRSLTVCELLHALGIPDTAEIEFLASDESFQKRIPLERRIPHCSGNFLEIKRHSGIRTFKSRPSLKLTNIQNTLWYKLCIKQFAIFSSAPMDMYPCPSLG